MCESVGARDGRRVGRQVIAVQTAMRRGIAAPAEPNASAVEVSESPSTAAAVAAAQRYAAIQTCVQNMGCRIKLRYNELLLPNFTVLVRSRQRASARPPWRGARNRVLWHAQAGCCLRECQQDSAGVMRDAARSGECHQPRASSSHCSRSTEKDIRCKSSYHFSAHTKPSELFALRARNNVRRQRCSYEELRQRLVCHGG